jgi:glycerol-3-phosphate dehydrogenase (NAD(P)+)
LLPEVAEEVFGEGSHEFICCLSGPSHAEEVVLQLPTSVVSSSKNLKLASDVQDLFSTSYFRVYTNRDLLGVAFGGAMKNIIAIACGISDGLGFGDNTKAALMTRGLHEIKKLAKYKGAKADTLSGLAGLGDLCVTCLSNHSRNYRFGHLIAKGKTADEARKEIGMAVEGAYTVVSAKQLSDRNEVPMPITESVYKVLFEGFSPKDAVRELMQRSSKEEMI